MSTPTSTAFSVFFPGNAMVNSLLATSYISIIPNLLLYFAPPDITPSTLNVLANFAIGSLLGDVFLHLLPHCFQSQDHHHGDDHGHGHGHDDNHKNVLVGTGIFAGLFLFYAADKCMRFYFGRAGHDHNHDHHHHQDEKLADQVDKPDHLRQRKPNKKKDNDDLKKQEKKPDIRASTYLNLLADFTHNLTDGIALAASFYASPAVGATTAVAVFFHEIPHEISDYAILLKSGFSKRRAMMAQFTTAVGAYIGTCIGIAIEELAFRLDAHHHGWSELIIPVTAGGFLYIATVGVIPELLESTHTSKLQPVKELTAMIFGMAVMATIAWNEQHHH